MSTHRDVARLLACRAELSDADEARLSKHLATCTRCQRQAAQFAEDAALLRALPRPTPPRAIRQGVLARIRQQPQTGQGTFPNSTDSQVG